MNSVILAKYHLLLTNNEVEGQKIYNLAVITTNK